MKKITFISAILFSFVTIYSCSNNTTDNELEKENNKKDVVKVDNNKLKAKVEDKSTLEKKPISEGKPIHLTKELFLKLVMDYEKNPDKWIYKGDLPCIIDFYADWCRPCRMAAPVLEELATEYEGKLYIYKVDIETQKEIAQVFGIQSLPSFLYCPMQGEPQMSSGVGRTNEETKVLFVKMINEVLIK